MSQLDAAIDVLLIEDDERLALLIVRYLEHHGLRVTVRHDGLSGYEEARNHEYECIVLDRMLPGRSGLDICRDLRARGAVPIIFLTAQSHAEDRAEGLLAGANEYVTKPFSARDLLDRVRAIVQRDAAANEKRR